MEGLSPLQWTTTDYFHGVSTVLSDGQTCTLINVKNGWPHVSIIHKAHVCHGIVSKLCPCPNCDFVGGIEMFYNVYCTKGGIEWLNQKNGSA